ncbi:flagellar protein FlgN [Desulfosporosinus sp. PR]|uniref:flagellar protein FlgN n=1 Tax=Candidatus Desulfosporosinus nitrosoreducens TaxID=3401928 RepID=UPI0027FA2651|nr:flagellar protein FlgN [Desulfosporosinus sp. PR]MDQ7096265.1 flagellar protein FlgN [Desulfosporosinus sp. PR]
MTEVLQNLNDNLKKQVSLYGKLLSLEKRKQRALLANNLQEIEVATGLEEQLLLEAGHLERERLAWAEQIGRALGKTPEDLTLAELAEHFPLLQEVRQELEGVVGGLKEIHELNSQLLQQAMKIVDFTLGMITHQEKSTYTYPGRKEKDGNKSVHLLDWRV